MMISFNPRTKQKPWVDARVYLDGHHATNIHGKNARGRVLFASAEELAKRWRPALLRDYIKDLLAEPILYNTSLAKTKGELFIEPQEWPTDGKDLAYLLWEVIMVYGDRVQGVPDSPEQDDRYTIFIDKLKANAELKPKWNMKQKQARQLLQMLLLNGHGAVREPELQAMVKNLVKTGVLKTKQDPWRVFMFYAPQFMDHGYITYPGRRKAVVEVDLDAAE